MPNDIIRAWKDPQGPDPADSPVGGPDPSEAFGGLRANTEHVGTAGCCHGITNESTCGACPTDFFC